MSIPEPSTVDRVKSTCFASAASTGNVVRVTHTSTLLPLHISTTEATVGIEKEAAEGNNKYNFNYIDKYC